MRYASGMTVRDPGLAPTSGRHFASYAVAIDVRARARRAMGWIFAAALLTMTPLAFIVSGYLFLVAIVSGLILMGVAVAPRMRVLGPGAGTIDIRDGALEVTVDDPRRGRCTRRYGLGAIARGYRTDDEVRLQTWKGEVVSVYIDGATMGEEVLRAAGQDARQRVLEMPVASIASRVPTATTLAWLGLVFQGMPSLIMIPLFLVLALTEPHHLDEGLGLLGVAGVEALFLAAYIKLLLPRRVAIGADGIRFRRFFRRRFHPYAGIADVTLVEGGVRLSMRSGKTLRLRTTSWWPRSGIDESALALHERIEAARASAAPPHDVRAKLPLLERRGLGAEAWRAHLGGLLGKAGYRTSALTPQDLGAVIDDASLSAEHRVAAAVALSAAEPEEARARARIAASACADEDLRAALDSAAEGELDEERLGRLALRVRG